MKKAFAILAVAAALLVPGVMAGYSVENQNDLTLPKGQTRSGTYYATGQTITIDGDVDGDLICGGQTVSVNGAVHGDVICAGQSVTLNGPVDGSVRVAGQSVSVNGTVGRNVTVAGQSFTLGAPAHVSGDMGVLGQSVAVNGTVEKDVYGGMGDLVLASSVGPVSVYLNSLALNPAAKVNGNLHYVSENTFNLDKSKVSGDITHSTPPPSQRQAQSQENAARAGFALRLYWIFAALLLGLAFVWLAPKSMARVGRIMRERPGASIGWGLVVTLLGPLVAIVLMVTVLGIPLGLLVGALWLLLVLTSGIFAGVATGLWLLERADWERGSLWWAALLGVPLAVILFSVPFVGGLIGLVATWWAVGGLSLAARAVRA